MTYTAIWEIEVDAASHEEAARKALTIMRDAGRTVETFDVIDERGEIERLEAVSSGRVECRACQQRRLAAYQISCPD